MNVHKGRNGVAYRKAAELKRKIQDVVMSCKSIIKDMFRSNLSTNKSRLLIY